MMDIASCLIAIITVSCFYLAYIIKRRNGKGAKGTKFPPGPRGLPLLGNILSIKANDHKSYRELMKYGDVCCIQIGLSRVFVLNSYEAAHEALVDKGDIFSGRPQVPLIEQLTRKCGVGFIDGPIWKEHRRVMLRALREFGVGKKTAEDIVKDEFNLLREQLTPNEPVDTRKLFEPVVSNVIGRLLFKERSGADDPDVHDINKYLNVIGTASPIVYLPGVDVLMKIPIMKIVLGGVEQFMKAWNNMQYLIKKKIDQRRCELHEMGTVSTDVREANDVCDYLLIEKNLHEAANPGGHTFTEWQIIGNLMDVYGAGVDTTTTSLRWMVLLLSISPEVQRKAQREIAEKIGCDRLPSMSDRADLPYVSAVLDEISRYTTIATSNVAHRALEDTDVMGYFVPANTIVQTNLYGIHHNPQHWEKPDEFYPEHFLSEDGQYKPSKYLIPFSIGKRACIGETLAKTQLFIGLVMILQVFSVSRPESKVTNEELMIGETGLTVRPKTHEIIFSKLLR